MTSHQQAGGYMQPREHHAPSEPWPMPPIDRLDPQVEQSGATMVPKDFTPASLPKKSRRKLDPPMKEEICRLVAGGHTLFEAACIVGVNRRTVLREKQRDPLFKMQLSQKRNSIAHLCLNTMHDAAAKKWQAAERFFKLVYPDRYHYRPRMISEKQHEKVLAEMIKIFSSVATPEQMLKLDRLFNSPGKPRMPEVQT
jgi:hypothetical protein